MNLTVTFLPLLEPFRPVFTAPSFLIFVDVVVGWVLSHRRRYVTELILSSGSVDKGHISRYHYFFAHGSWCLDHLFEVLARELVRVLAPAARTRRRNLHRHRRHAVSQARADAFRRGHAP